MDLELGSVRWRCLFGSETLRGSGLLVVVVDASEIFALELIELLELPLIGNISVFHLEFILCNVVVPFTKVHHSIGPLADFQHFVLQYSTKCYC